MWPVFHSSFSRTSPSWTSPERIRSWTCSGVASWTRFLISAKKSRYVGIRAPLRSILNRPVHSEIPGMLGFPRGDAVIRPAPVPLPPGARDPGRWVARARHGGGARSLRYITVASGCRHPVRERARTLRRSRHLLGVRADDHERLQGGRLRGHRSAGYARGAALGRARRSRPSNALLERVGQSGRPADP